MAHFAQVRDDTGEVLRVIVIANDEIVDGDGVESEVMGVARCEEHAALEHPDVGPDYAGATSWVQTSYNHNIRKNYAYIGGTYDPVNDLFHHPQPYPSWVLDLDTGQWEAPTPRPDSEKFYYWDEDTTSWVEVEE